MLVFEWWELLLVIVFALAIFGIIIYFINKAKRIKEEKEMKKMLIAAAESLFESMTEEYEELKLLDLTNDEREQIDKEYNDAKKKYEETMKKCEKSHLKRKERR